MAATTTRTWDDLETLPSDVRPSIIWASTGEAGSGKSYFGLTAPDPIWVAALDPWGMNRVDKSVKADKDIRISRYPFDVTKFKTQNDVQKHATEVWNRFLEDYQIALKNARTILWDREDMVYKLQRYTNFGGSNAAPKEYEDLYAEYVAMVQAANANGVNLGLLRGLKDKWVSKFDPAKGKMVGHNTGERIGEGMSKVPDHVDITLFHRWDEKSKAYVVQIGKFTQPSERDMEYPNLTFSDMAMLAYPDTTEEDWK